MPTAVLETIRTYHQKPFRLDDHLARLFISADVIGLTSPWNAELAKREVEKVLNGFLAENTGESKIRIILSEKDLAVTAEPLEEKPTEMYNDGVNLVTYVGSRENPHIKHPDDALSRLAKDYATAHGAYESLLVDAKGNVRECAYANVFWVNGGELYTTSKGILLGITRQTVMELANGSSAVLDGCHFSEISLPDLLNAEEIFITQTTSGILPASEIDDHKIGGGKPGPITRTLMKEFNKKVWGS